jgi:hypothetical protein
VDTVVVVGQFPYIVLLNKGYGPSLYLIVISNDFKNVTFSYFEDYKRKTKICQTSKM